ncbi:MAG: Crp/Fnr family transcriptional regulator [Cyclobacteriaceae bacterium]|nr:Crp/Fnr family transcriptional regulator [Cyclobacteriaceae bacterium]
MRELISTHFPFFKEPELVDAILEVGKEVFIKEGEPIIRVGEFIKSTPLISDGLIKVIRQDDEGREILLYYLAGGDTCVMTVTCCMHQEKSKIKAIAEKDSRIILIPFHYMDEWMRSYRTWRNFILQTYSARFEEMLTTLDQTAFQSLDTRLIKYLNDKKLVLETDEFKITHQQIASELNSSREAISRLLKKLEGLNVIKLGRNKIQILKELK